MSEEYYHQLDWNDEADLETKVKALYNTHNWLTHEMSIGRVPNNKKEIENNLNLTKQKLEVPLSIAFVKMVEKGEIDEVTASENASLFLEWNIGVNYKANTLLQFGGLLYRVLQEHTSQADWEPNKTPSLYKVLGINENGIMEWSQPISSADAYMTGDEVIYNGVHYRSTIDNNVWSPEAYPQGWEEVVEEAPQIPETPQIPESPSGDTL